MKETKQIFNLSSGKILQVERHPNTEEPCFYPEKIVRLGNGTVGLVAPHSAYYTPTEENRQKLLKTTRTSNGWAYMHYLHKTR